MKKKIFKFSKFNLFIKVNYIIIHFLAFLISFSNIFIASNLLNCIFETIMDGGLKSMSTKNTQLTLDF